MNSTPHLEATLRYERKTFLLEAQFTLNAPWTVLFGPSGAGKTTLLRILAGLTEPSAGKLRLQDRLLLDTQTNIALAPGQRRIGFVTQQPSLFPHLTAHANIAFGLHQWSRAEREARIMEMLRFVDAEALAQRRPKQLSGGERQRIALAQVLAPQPDFLLLDEPFTALDAPSRTAIVEKLQATGIPAFYVSHELTDAWQMNADAILLEAGRITAKGETHTVLAPYRDRLLKQLGAQP